MKERILVPKIIVNCIMFVFFFEATRFVYYLDKTGMSTSTMFNIAIGILSLLGLSVLHLVHTMDDNPDKKSSWLFWGMVVITYVGVVCDNLSWAVDGIRKYRDINFILNVGGFLVMPVILILFWNYQNCVFIGKSKISERAQFIVNIFAIMDVVFILFGCIFGYIFHVDANGQFVYGEGMVISYIYPIIVIGCCIFDNLKRKLPIKKKLSLLAFGVVPIVAIIAVIPLPQYSFTYVVVFVDLILIYGTVQTKKSIELAQQSSQLANQKRELTEQKMQIMISQIQPHFLYNTLTAIHQLCDIDVRLAQKIILDFSVYLRNNMDAIKTTAPIPFEQELAHTKTYLQIELLRFDDILDVEYDIQVTEFEIPALTLQPLVENAVKYGIRSREEGGCVTISTKEEQDKIFITVHDDGMGFDVNEKKEDGRTHVGLENTRKRLQLMMNADLVIDSQIGVGTTVTIIVEKKDGSITG